MLKKGNLFNVILVLQVIIFVRYEARSSCNDRKWYRALCCSISTLQLLTFFIFGVDFAQIKS
jgi:hypothetical protein